MRRFRFHIGNLVILVLLLGVGLAALRESNDTWDSSIFTLTLGVLLTSILLAVHRAERKRAFWLGFALFGAAYLTLSVIPSIESRLITTKALVYLDSKVPGRSIELYSVINTGISSRTANNQLQNIFVTIDGNQAAPAGKGRAWTLAVTKGKLLNGWSGTTENFVRIGHSLFALLAGWLGGQLSLRLRRTSGEPAPTSAVEA